MSTLIRVVHQQLVRRSLLIDKVDMSQGNSEGYALKAKQKVYVPYSNPLDLTVKGYIDMVPTDEVLLSLSKGTIAGMIKSGQVTTTLFSSSLTTTPTLASAVASAATAVVGQTGAAASITTVSGGKATVTGLTGMTAGSVGRQLTISGAASGGNNGTFYIAEYVSATSVKVTNGSAVASDASNGSITWTEKLGPRLILTGTKLTSLAPDLTLITIGDGSGATQQLLHTALTDGSSSISATSIAISNTLITIGTPTTGWTAKVRANSKSSNQVTV